MMRVSDEHLEASVRGVLAEWRPDEDAPAELRGRVEMIPEGSRPSRLPSQLRTAISIAGGLAGLAAVAVIVVLAVSRMANLPAVPYLEPGAGPTPQAFDPSIEGPGIISSVDAQLQRIPWAVALMGWVWLGAFAVVVTVGPWRVRAGIALALVVALGAGAAGLSGHRGFEFGGAFGGRLGVDVVANPPPGSNGPSVMYVTAEAGAPFVIALVVRNPGPLPIRFLGVVDPSGPGVLYHWAAVWLSDDTQGGLPEAEAASAFHPVDVAPGGLLSLYLVGRAGQCAAGSQFRVEEAGSFGSQGSSDIRVAYSVAGLTATDNVSLPVVVAEPFLPDCPRV